MIRDLIASRELAWRLFTRDLRARHRQSILGYSWAFLPPLFTTLAFVLLDRNGIINGGNTQIPYPAYVMTGTLLWSVFADAVVSPIRAMTTAKSMIAKINFPREALLLAGLLDVIFNFLIRLLLLTVVFGYYDIVPPTTAPLAIGGVIALCIFGFMIGIMLTPPGMLYTDFGNALGIVLSFWMLFTPVIYTPPTTGKLSFVISINPVTPLIVTTREWLTTGNSNQVWPAIFVFGISLLLLAGGWIILRLAMPILVERMGN